MTSTTIVPFAEEHVAGAATLLAERATRQRAAEPLLSLDDARTAIETLARAKDVSGNIAVRGDVVEAFVLARLDDDPLFGRNAWIGSAGYSTSDPELLRDVYASAADGWFRDGYRRHYVIVPALPDELDPWYRLGFHHMHVQVALRDTRADPPQPIGFSIREARTDDLDEVVRIDLLIFEHQRTTPSFGLVDIDPDLDERRAGWAEALADERFRLFVAERDGRIVGHAGVVPADPEFAIPADTIDIASVAVAPTERGMGVGVALTLHTFGWAAAHGHPVIQASWRITNLLASRFWAARGLRPVYHRLHRALGLG